MKTHACFTSNVEIPVLYLDDNVPFLSSIEMSPYSDLQIRRSPLGGREMSKRELGRFQVLARVRSKQLQVVDAGRPMRVSYRQAKRLWKRYREEGPTGLKHRSAGRPVESSSRA